MASATIKDWNAAWTLHMRQHRNAITDNMFDSYPLLNKLRGSATDYTASEDNPYHLFEHFQFSRDREHRTDYPMVRYIGPGVIDGDVILDRPGETVICAPGTTINGEVVISADNCTFAGESTS